MAKYNPRLAKIHRNYTVEEVSSLYDIHKNTVREWIKKGLLVLDRKRPILILGSELRRFLEEKRKKNKRPCAPGQIYCVKCKQPRFPIDMEADYQPVSETIGDLVGMCSSCEILIYRKVSLAKLDVVRGDLNITFPQGLKHLNESRELSLNSAFK